MTEEQRSFAREGVDIWKILIEMELNNPIESGLPSHLFWDVDIQQLDWETNARLIVERVIERGSYKDLLLIQEKYGKQRIGAILKQTVFMPPKDIWFVHIYFDIPLKSLKCYNGQF